MPHERQLHHLDLMHLRDRAPDRTADLLELLALVQPDLRDDRRPLAFARAPRKRRDAARAYRAVRGLRGELESAACRFIPRTMTTSFARPTTNSSPLLT